MHCIGKEEKNIYGVHTEIAPGLYNLGALHEVHDYRLKLTYQGFEKLCDDLLTKLTKAQVQLIKELQKGTHVCICNSCNSGTSALPKYVYV